MAQRPWWLSLMLATVVLACGAAPSDDEVLERNRLRLAAWRSNPEHGTRLARDLRDFYALPAERQARLRDLDARLHASDEARQVRLLTALERYATWLDRLSAETRQQVQAAPTPQARLERVHALRQQEWIARLPSRDRAELAALPEAERTKRVVAMRQEERRRRGGERIVPEEMKIARLARMPAEVQAFVKGSLLPRLPTSEKAALEKLEGKWPEYPRRIAELTENYLVLRSLPESPLVFADLPKDLKSRLGKEGKGKKLPGNLRNTRGWPEFALALAKTCKAARITPPLLGACKPEHYPPLTRVFIDKELVPVLARGESDALKADEGRWPDYPQRLAMLARLHGLVIPDVSLPGPHDLWPSAKD